MHFALCTSQIVSQIYKHKRSSRLTFFTVTKDNRIQLLSKYDILSMYIHSILQWVLRASAVHRMQRRKVNLDSTNFLDFFSPIDEKRITANEWRTHATFKNKFFFRCKIWWIVLQIWLSSILKTKQSSFFGDALGNSISST